MYEQFKPFLAHYVFRIRPTEKQKELFAKTFEACKFVHNRLLTDAKAEYEVYEQLCKTSGSTELQKPSVTPFDLVNKLIIIKSQEETAWLKDVPAVALQQTAMHLGNDLRRFFRTGKDCPEFKKKNNSQYFTLTKKAFRFKEGKLYIVKSKEPLDVFYSRELPSDPSSLTINKTPSGEYYISFVAEYDPN
jgi:putative transposase